MPFSLSFFFVFFFLFFFFVLPSVPPCKSPSISVSSSSFAILRSHFKANLKFSAFLLFHVDIRFTCASSNNFRLSVFRDDFRNLLLLFDFVFVKPDCVCDYKVCFTFSRFLLTFAYLKHDVLRCCLLVGSLDPLVGFSVYTNTGIRITFFLYFPRSF